MTATYVVGTVEYLKAVVTCDFTLDAQPVAIRLDSGAWQPATWVGAAGLVRTAEALVDFASVTPGRHTVYVKVTDTPEVPILSAGPIHVGP
jgi:hypothetical protein